MRIALVSEHASPLAAVGGVDAGGQNVHVAALAAALVRRGHAVTVFTRQDRPDLPRTVLTDDGYEVRHLLAGPPTDIPKDELLPHLPELARSLERALLEEEFDLVHGHFWMSGLAAVAAAQAAASRRGSRIPVVQTFHALGSVKRRHQGAQDTSPPGRIRSESLLCQQVDHVVATCSDEVRELTALGLPAGRATVVPCGVDPVWFRPEGPTAVRTSRPRVLAVGRLVPRKGVEDVIRAMTQLPGVELLVAGGPARDALDYDPEARRLTQISHRLGLADRVVLLGAVGRDSMPALLRSADVVVATPWYEPFGIVPLEAMACARPVVAAAVGGLTDTVVDGVTGALVPARDPDAVARALATLLADTSLRRAYGAAGRRRVLIRYSWDRVAAATDAAYTAACADRIRLRPPRIRTLPW